MGNCLKAGVHSEAFPIVAKTPFQYRLLPDELDHFASYFYLRQHSPQECVASAVSNPEFIIVGDGIVDVMIEGTKLCSKTKGDFLGRIALSTASVLERKESLLVFAQSLDSLDEMEEEEELELRQSPLSAASKGKRASAIDTVRLSTAIARTEVTVAVLSKDAFSEYWSQISPKLREVVMVTMGSAVTKNLAALPFLQGITPKRVELLSNMLHYVPLNEGEVLFEEGSLGSQLYIIYQGSCKAVANMEDEAAPDQTHEVTLNNLKEGDFFGEISLIMGMPRTATIIATEPSVLLELRKDDFQNFLKLTPNLPFHELMKRRFANHFKKYKVPFFAAIPDDRYPLLASLCKVEQVEPNVVIFSEGEVATTFYILAHGECVVTTKRRHSVTCAGHNQDEMQEIELGRMGPGKYFGEIALIRSTKRTATVRTMTRCVILSITKENFEEFFQECPEALADFEVKLARYDVAMRSVIYHPIGLEYFTKFLQKEFSSENIAFWKAARDYRHLADSAAGDFQNASSQQDLPQLRRGYTVDKDIHVVSKVNSKYVPLDFDGLPSPSGSPSSLHWTGGSSLSRVNTVAGRLATKDPPPELTARMLQAAREITNKYIKENSELQININFDTRRVIEARVERGEVDLLLFTNAEKEVLALLERDSFSRFKQSELFKEFLQQAESYDEKRQLDEIKDSSARDPKLRSGSVISTDPNSPSARRREIADALRRRSENEILKTTTATAAAAAAALLAADGANDAVAPAQVELDVEAPPPSFSSVELAQPLAPMTDDAQGLLESQSAQSVPEI